jgi:peroxiredoxin
VEAAVLPREQIGEAAGADVFIICVNLRSSAVLFSSLCLHEKASIPLTDPRCRPNCKIFMSFPDVLLYILTPTTQTTTMTLKVGDLAPDFTLVTKSADGPQLVKLGELVGKSNIVLLFVPMAFTGVCTTEFCEISAGLKDYEALDAKVLGISGDNPFAQAAWAEKEGITIPLLSDYEHAIAKAYGVAYEQFLPEANLIMGGVAKRSAFVIDRGGIIRYAEVQEHPKDLPDFEAVKACLRAL